MIRKLMPLLLIMGCSTTDVGSRESDDRGLPVIVYAGPESSALCSGETTTIRIEATDEDGGPFTYLLTGENGVILQNPHDPSVWTYTNDSSQSSTKFWVHVGNEKGYSSTGFTVYNLFGCKDDTGGEAIDLHRKHHVILMIGDGMGKHCEVALTRYLYGTDQGMFVHSFPYANHVTTWDIETYNQFAWDLIADPFDPDSFDPDLGYATAKGGDTPFRNAVTADEYFLSKLKDWPVDDQVTSARIPATDSAAAATALACGTKTQRYNLSWLPGDPPDGAIPTVAELARSQKAMGIGVVTTVPFSHATPAAFVTHNVNRANYHDIANDIIHRARPDVVIGAGHPIFYNSDRYISEDDYQYLKTTDTWQFVERVTDVNGGESLMAAAKAAVAAGKPLFGLYGKESFESFKAANDPGFPLIVPLTEDNPSLAEATEAALTVLQENPEGFFLMVEAGDIDLGNHRHDYKRLIGNMYDFDLAIEAAVEWVNRDGDDMDWSNTLIIVTADHANGYLTFDEDHPLEPGELPVMATEGEFMYEDAIVDFQANGHTNELVSIYAIGAGQEADPSVLFGPFEEQLYPGLPIIDNTHIFSVMMNFMGLDQP